MRKGMLHVVPAVRTNETSAPKGLYAIELDTERDALLYVPPSYTPHNSAPLAVMLHGAGGDAQHGMSLLQANADAAGIIILAPFARGATWDIIEEERFGPDVVFISAAMQQVFGQYVIDARKIAVGGFSDGASYALSLGLINGTLFTHVLAFSPGFYYAPEVTGYPHIYISHGVDDAILPINYCSRRIVPRLQKQNYDVVYREFDGPHILTDAIRNEAVASFQDTA